jgi:hypothetical protein
MWRALISGYNLTNVAVTGENAGKNNRVVLRHFIVY